MIPSVVVEQVRRSILDYLRATFGFADEAFVAAFFEFLESERGIFRGPWLDVRLPFRTGEIDVVAEEQPLDLMPSFPPYAHQLQAFRNLRSKDGRQPQHTLVTTGTGSGKTECFLFPLLDHCVRERKAGIDGIKAIILYPMNALASDQARRLAKMLHDDEHLKDSGVTAGLYVGGKGTHGRADGEHLVDQRDVLRKSPPDILLTNYKMLDFLLLRPEDADLWRLNRPATLRYLVLDELHSYDGAQGSDIACLIRRLKARLGVPTHDKHSICCVGTSATIGGEDVDSDKALTRFASEIFGVTFDRSSLVREDRQTANEALGDVFEDTVTPNVGLSELDPDMASSVSEYYEAQERIWFGRTFDNPFELGQALSGHGLLRSLLEIIGGRPKAFDQIDLALSDAEDGWNDRDPEVRRALLESYVALISKARTRTLQGDEAPFLSVQVQLWVRELRALMRRVDTAPAFAWEDEIHSTQDARYLPIGHCRDCGCSGFAARIHQTKQQVLDKRSDIGHAWLEKAPMSAFILPGKLEGELINHRLDLSDLSLGHASDGELDPELAMDVIVEQTCSGEGRRRRFLFRCPECGAEDALRILGSRAPSLLSVAISEQYLTPYNKDKKLLAFTDSVQDASHRAGFFGARTYRFNMRSAIQGLLESRDEDLSLSTFAEEMMEYWQDQKREKNEIVATFWPRDLGRIEAYDRYMEKPDERNFNYLKSRFLKRLSWEVTQEFGYAALLGRSLEKASCSTLVVDQDAFRAAVGELELELSEERVFGEEVIGASSVRQFLAAILMRTRQRGGIMHPLLKTYVERDGASYLLSKRMNPYLSPFGKYSRQPKFLTSRPGHEVFDSFMGKGLTWYVDFAARCFGVSNNSPGILELYRATMAACVRSGIFLEVESKKGASVWGLNPEKLKVTKKVVALQCSDTNRRYLVAESMLDCFADAPSPVFRGNGRLHSIPLQDDVYYARVYRSGNIERIFVGEHTGLLNRDNRENLEDRFKKRKRPDDENLLVCTPTLEMGIDIGDLSTTVLCSVPPAPANYLQRIGRGGRSTGNSLTMTMAVTRPHDLYFLEQPEEILAGSVEPPGCFLEAPEMLKRQLAAFCMDAWARNDEHASPIPRKVEMVLSERGQRIFPGQFLEFEEGHRQGLLDEFLKVFGGNLDAEDRNMLTDFAIKGEVSAAISGAFAAIGEELKELRSQTTRLKTRLRDLEEGLIDDVPPDEVDAAIEETNHGIQSLRRVAGELRLKYPLNVLTDAGVLPNYAFPEPGVVLKSVIRKRKDMDAGGEKKFEYVTLEYQRPASAALREFAPGNTFYAEGHQVKITDLDVGSQGKPKVEIWRFCDNCHMTVLAANDVSTEDSCPRCGSLGWHDAGQLRKMIRFSEARSFSEDIESISVDDDDDRDRLFYEFQALVDVDPVQHGSGARLVEELPFGYELLRGVELKEINLGHLRTDTPSADFMTAGDENVAPGFKVCMDCGRVSDPERNFAKNKIDIDHSLWCAARKGKKERIETVFLYRRLESQAIRVLLPVALEETHDTEVNFRAALQLGLRKKFKGNPIHLSIRSMTEPYEDHEFARRRFLVIFDTVPGGTGYLAQLWRNDGFIEVLELALEAIRSCRCRQTKGREGCYHCLYAYQEQANLSVIKRSVCERLLEEILGAKGRLKDIKTLSEARLSTRMESELEVRFVRLLHELMDSPKTGLPKVQIEDELPGAQWSLTVGNQRWRLRAQLQLGSSEGVSVPTRPDFVLDMPDAPHAQGIAVYGDGFTYHVEKEKIQSRIEDDVLKRRAIIHSQDWIVWSYTWRDLDHFEGKGDSAQLFMGHKDSKNVREFLVRKGKGLTALLEQTDPFSGLLALLSEGDPRNQVSPIKIATTVLLGIQRSFPLDADIAKVENALGTISWPLLDGNVDYHGSRPQSPSLLRLGQHVALLLKLQSAPSLENPTPALKARLRLNDTFVARSEDDFEHDWRSFLGCVNVLQFLPQFEFTSTERLVLENPSLVDENAESSRGLQAAEPTIEASEEELQEILEFAGEHLAPMVEHALTLGHPLPEVPFELFVSGQVVAQADVAWPEERVAFMSEESEDALCFHNRNWVVLLPQDGVDGVDKTLGSQSTSGEA